MKSKGLLALIIILSVILVDQIVKIYIKTHFYLGESVEVASWFKILFIENNGMAFGMELGSKIFLTLLRIVVVGLVIYYVCHIKNNPKLKTGYLISLSLIIAGAAGNILDSMFYGIIFNDPIPPTVAEMFPEDGGYAPFLYGRVVDMLYFPLFSFNWPDWIPFIGGDLFIFFQPVFNIADAAITVGILLLIIFYSSQLTELQQQPKPAEEDNGVAVD
ncbi:MAG: lipoprotein signal peptidase [Muribaculaceae bacterium]|nr:lipoprotein signal peptidase [Muribaculaceae bacterium]MDE6644117.1 lipoprotein signal peptidase [Muribaculaceae bacterium]